MYVIINKDGQVYNGSTSGTRHYWGDVNRFHFHAVLFTVQEDVDEVNRLLGVEGTKVIPVTELK